MAVANAAGAYAGSALAVKRGDRLVRAVVLAVVAHKNPADVRKRDDEIT